jgi:hypothetical protein
MADGMRLEKRANVPSCPLVPLPNAHSRPVSSTVDAYDVGGTIRTIAGGDS